MNLNRSQNAEFHTERLTLRILNEQDGEKVLFFQQKNAPVFEAVEPDRPEHFYTLRYQKAVLNIEYNMYIHKTCLRFWVFERTDPDQIIGTVSFNFVIPSPFQTCQMGYKFDPDYWNRGYATEAICIAVKIAAAYLNLHRIEAYVLPDNLPSIRVLEKLSFHPEGLAPKMILMKGNWEDHLRYSIIPEA